MNNVREATRRETTTKIRANKKKRFFNENKLFNRLPTLTILLKNRFQLSIVDCVQQKSEIEKDWEKKFCEVATWMSQWYELGSSWKCQKRETLFIRRSLIHFYVFCFFLQSVCTIFYKTIHSYKNSFMGLGIDIKRNEVTSRHTQYIYLFQSQRVCWYFLFCNMHLNVEWQVKFQSWNMLFLQALFYFNPVVITNKDSKTKSVRLFFGFLFSSIFNVKCQQLRSQSKVIVSIWTERKRIYGLVEEVTFECQL